MAIASTSGFSTYAQEFAATHRISLIEFNKMPFWNKLMNLIGEKGDADIEEEELKKNVDKISSHMAVAITNMGQLLFLYCQSGMVDFPADEYDILWRNKNEPWTLRCGDKEYSFQLPEYIIESWINYSENEIEMKKKVIENKSTFFSNMIVYYCCDQKPVIKMISIDFEKLKEAKKKLNEIANGNDK